MRFGADGDKLVALRRGNVNVIYIGPKRNV